MKNYGLVFGFAGNEDFANVKANSEEEAKAIFLKELPGAHIFDCFCVDGKTVDF